MRRREFITLVGGAAAWPVASRAQQRERIHRIGVLFGPDRNAGSLKNLAAFVAGLEALGWKQDVNVQMDYRWAGGDAGRARTFAMELVSFSPAVILGSSTVATQALYDATTTVPIVFVNVTDPVAGGFVSSLARPSGNITGFTPFEYDICGKWLELLKEMAPRLTRVAMLGDPNNHNFKGFQRSFETAAKSMSVEWISVPVRSADDIDRGIRSLAEQANGGLIVSAAAFSMANLGQIVELAIGYKLPAIFWNRSQVAGGGLMSFGPDPVDMYRRAASYVDRILKGEKPGDLPVQEPTKVELIINAQTAKAINLVVPPALLARADEVIE
jgi:putative tryptophan/tyrosine transport system substrate-binding protein